MDQEGEEIIEEIIIDDKDKVKVEVNNLDYEVLYDEDIK